jgi:hypothetical protein
VDAYSSFKELWKGNFNSKIEKLLAMDINKNGINEILVGRYKNLNLLEWKKDTFIDRWQSPEFQRAVDFEYYEYNNFLLVKKYNPQDKPKPITPHTLLYEDGKYILKEIEETQIPFLPGEKYIISGSFKRRDAKDVIVTTDTITYGMKPEGHLYLKGDRSLYNILWTSPFKIYKYGVVPLFGDFDGDQKIELLLLLEGETKGYWIFPKGNEFEVKEIKSYKKTKDTTLWLFPLSTSDPERYFKIGRTTSKNFDEIFYIHEYLYGGPLFKAVWQKDRFNYQEILSIKKLNRKKGAIGYENLNLSDIDNDGLDEIIISEIRGDLIETEEEPYVENYRDVIHILKWNGKGYKKIWTSKPLGAITQVLIDDVTGDGKKEIVVGNDKGEIHIFGQN